MLVAAQFHLMIYIGYINMLNEVDDDIERNDITREQRIEIEKKNKLIERILLHIVYITYI